MSASRSERIRELFVGACDLDTAARAAFLERECGADADLRAEVELLFGYDGDDHTAFSEREVEGRFLLRSTAGLAPPPAREAAIEPIVPGTRIGRYTILGTLGVGGMGAVYEAEQDEPCRRVAIKVLRSGASSAELLRRFRREAQVLARLQHPGIAQIIEAGTFEAGGGSLPFFAMELVDGEPIHSAADQRGLGTRARMELVAEVCDAVGHAHERGVVHRDLKPDNILVDRGGRPRVLDFGVARITDADTQLVTLSTGVGQLIGTLPYMSPEQVSGEKGVVDARADVYALGVLLYELLAGRLPLDLTGCSIPEAARIILEEEPTALGQVSGELRGDVEVIVAQALAKEPRRRYADAGALGADLRRHLNDEAIAARRISTFHHLARFARRHKAIVAGLTVAFLALAVALGISLDRTRAALDARAATAREANRATLAAANVGVEAGMPVVARELLESIDEDERSWEWRHLWSRLDMSLAELELGEHRLDTTWSADGGQLMSVSSSGRLENLDPYSGEVRSERPLGVGALALATFSESGARLLAISGAGPYEVGLWDVSTGEQLASEGPVDSLPVRLRVADSGDYAAWVVEGLGLQVWDVTSGASRSATLPRMNAALTESTFALRESKVALAGKHGEIASADLGAPEPSFQIARTPRGVPALSLAISPDGRRLAAGSRDTRVRLFDLESLELELELSGHTGPITAVAFGRDGRLLLSAANDGTIRVWELASRACVGVLTGLEGKRVTSLSSTGDGARLSSRANDGTTHIWAPSVHEELSVLRGHQRFVYDLTFTNDGRHIASGSWDGTLRLWAIGEDEPLWTRRREAAVSTLALSPDGSTLASSGRNGGIELLGMGRADAARSIGAGIDASDLAWFPDSSALVVAPKGRRKNESSAALVLNASDGSERARLGVLDHRAQCVAVSPDGTRIATGSNDSSLTIWDARSFAPLARLEGHTGELHSVSFSADSALLVSASADETARIWEVGSGACLHELVGHRGRVWSAEFSPDGTRVATGADDPLVRLFDVEGGALVVQLRGHEDYVHAVAFSPDGALLASASGDGTLRLWDTRPLRERFLASGAGEGR